MRVKQNQSDRQIAYQRQGRSRRQWLASLAKNAGGGILARSVLARGILAGGILAGGSLDLPRLAAADPDSPNELQRADPSFLQKIVIRDSEGSPRPVLAMDLDADRGLLCVAAADSRLRFFDAGTLQSMGNVAAHRDRIRCVRFSPDGRRLASVGNDGMLLIWNVGETISIRQRMEGTPALACVDFDRSGEQLVAGGFGKQLYVLGSPRSVRIQCERGDLRAIAHLDGRILAGGRHGWLHAFENRRELLERKINPGSINAIIPLRGTPRTVSVCDGGAVVVYDFDTDQILHRIDLGVGRLFSVVAISSDRVAVAGSDDQIRIVDLSEEKTIANLSGHSGSVSSLVTMDGTLISAGYDATVRRWDLQSFLRDVDRVAIGGDETTSPPRR
ncbi:MAG: hypothetical protein AAF958_08525 [Planctomycetota bacterium]